MQPLIHRVELYDYNSVIDILEATKGYKVRDFAGKYKEKFQLFGVSVLKESYLVYLKAVELGYTEQQINWWFTGNHKPDSLEMKTRLEIQSLKTPEMKEEVPYLDFWHEVMNDECHNGSEMYISTNEEDYEDREWVYGIIKDIMELFPADKCPLMYNGEDLQFWVEW